MKKTRFEKFMASLTKKALAEQTLETYEEHLKFVRISIEMELLKKGKKKERPTKKAERSQSRVDQVSGALGTTKRTAIRIGAGLTKIFGFLGEGRNATYVIMGSIFAYAVIVMILEMF